MNLLKLVIRLLNEFSNPNKSFNHTYFESKNLEIKKQEVKTKDGIEFSLKCRFQLRAIDFLEYSTFYLKTFSGVSSHSDVYTHLKIFKRFVNYWID